MPKDTGAALPRFASSSPTPKLTSSLSHLERTLGRLDRITGGGSGDLTTTLENLRQITDNLRQLNEDTKRYPSTCCFGQPPLPTRWSD